LKIISSNELGEKILATKFFYDYIPGLVMSKAAMVSDGEVELYENSKFNFEFKDGVGEIHFSLGKNLSMMDLVTLIDYLLEYFRQKMGVYCLHGSAISIKGNGVWFMGPISGLGKTTLALNMCLRNDCKFIGDEKILLDKKGNLIEGIKNINYNKELLTKSVAVNFDGMVEKDIQNVLELEKNLVRLKLIILPILMRGAGFIEIDKWKIEKSSFHIYEQLSLKIRAVSRRLNNFVVPIQSIDNDELSQKRSDFANEIVKNVEVYMLKGDEKSVAQKILELV